MTNHLRDNIFLALKEQGYEIDGNGLYYLKNTDREDKRKAHEVSKAEKMAKQENFIIRNLGLIKSHLLDGKDLEVENIDPEMIEVKGGSHEEQLFRWWNIVWWSLPYERAYGRQIRFIVWDKYHNAPIGLIGLQSPILSWGPRDKYLGITSEKRDFWVNQSLNAQRLGALPPYNDILGGKLIALLMTSNIVRRIFEQKYEGQKTIMQGRTLPSNLLFMTTTGAYGKSSVYNRLKFQNEQVAKFLGYTQGSGTFHISDLLYEDLLKYLQCKGVNVKRGCGQGSSRKLRLMDQALRLLGFANGVTHGIQRALYLFPLIYNLEKVIQEGEEPLWISRDMGEMTDFWKARWGCSRAKNDPSYLEFSGSHFIEQTMADLEKYKALLRHFHHGEF